MTPAAVRPVTSHPIASLHCRKERTGNICPSGLLPILTQSSGLERDTLYFHYPNYAFHKQNRLGSALREGDYKLIKNYDENSLELYDLHQNIGEKTNIAPQSPELANRLAGKLDAWLRESDAGCRSIGRKSDKAAPLVGAASVGFPEA